MVLDSSAIVAVHLREPGYQQLSLKIESAEIRLIGTPTVLETAMVLTARIGQDARPMLYAFLRHLDIHIVAFNEQHLDTAINAFLRFGRGRHRANLTFGDCQSYSIAAVAGMPLLFTSNDFTYTDVGNSHPQTGF